MAAKEKVVCPRCGQLRKSRGLQQHLKMCGVEVVVEPHPLAQRYAKQIAHMRPEQAERFLRKAQGL